MLLMKGFKLLQALASDHLVASVHGVHSNACILGDVFDIEYG